MNFEANPVSSNPILGSGQGSSTLFQCQPSSEQDGLVFVPNILDFHFNHSAVASSIIGNTSDLMRSGRLYILPLPSLSPQRDCNGSVLSIGYCYAARPSNLGRSLPIFTFLSLTQDGFQFTVDQRFTVRSTPLRNICSSLSPSEAVVCCDRMVLSREREFALPTSSYTFGLVVRRRRLLAFSDSASQYHALQFQQDVGTIRANFNLTKENQFSNRSIPLLRFLIGKGVITVQKCIVYIARAEPPFQLKLYT